MRPIRNRQLTSAPHGHILTNTAVWSADGRWIYYDVRSDPAGSQFDGTRIERVDVQTERVEVIYESRHGACCGVVTCHPSHDRIVFIHGPEHPDAKWSYGASRRSGAILEPGGEMEWLDARDLVPPFTQGALRGGTHVHTWSADGKWIAFTYEDQYLIEQEGKPAAESNQRLIGVACPTDVDVPAAHPRNQNGSHACAIVISANDSPKPRSSELLRACSDAWVGRNGYVNSEGNRVSKAIAFQGRVATDQGNMIDEVFIVDLPDVLEPSDPQIGTWENRRIPAASGCQTRRLTWTDDRKYPGIRGARHWLRSSPDGTLIACLMIDEKSVVQLHTVDPLGKELKQLTNNSADIGSAFTFSNDGEWIAHVWNGEIALTQVATGKTHALTTRENDELPVRPEACVWSPDDRFIAYVRPVACNGVIWNQIFAVELQA